LLVLWLSLFASLASFAASIPSGCSGVPVHISPCVTSAIQFPFPQYTYKGPFDNTAIIENLHDQIYVTLTPTSQFNTLAVPSFTAFQTVQIWWTSYHYTLFNNVNPTTISTSTPALSNIYSLTYSHFVSVNVQIAGYTNYVAAGPVFTCQYCDDLISISWIFFVAREPVLLSHLSQHYYLTNSQPAIWSVTNLVVLFIDDAEIFTDISANPQLANGLDGGSCTVGPSRYQVTSCSFNIFETGTYILYLRFGNQNNGAYSFFTTTVTVSSSFTFADTGGFNPVV